MSKALLELIDEYLAETGLSGHRFSKLVKHSMLHQRLQEGGRVWPETDMKVRAYIMRQREKPLEERRCHPRRRKTSTQQQEQVA